MYVCKYIYALSYQDLRLILSDLYCHIPLQLTCFTTDSHMYLW